MMNDSTNGFNFLNFRTGEVFIRRANQVVQVASGALPLGDNMIVRVSFICRIIFAETIDVNQVHERFSSASESLLPEDSVYSIVLSVSSPTSEVDFGKSANGRA